MGLPVLPPESFFAGDTVDFLYDAGSDYRPADGWSLKLYITNASNSYTQTSTDYGDGRHRITIDSTTTGSMAAGEYNLVLAAVKGSERHTVYSGRVRIRPNLTSATDARSNVKKTLDAIEAYMLDSNNLKLAQVEISTPGGGSRRLSQFPKAELIKLHSYYSKLYRQELAAERILSGKPPRRKLHVRVSA